LGDDSREFVEIVEHPAKRLPKQCPLEVSRLSGHDSCPCGGGKKYMHKKRNCLKKSDNFPFFITKIYLQGNILTSIRAIPSTNI
jgi:hypothetical protein